MAAPIQDRSISRPFERPNLGGDRAATLSGRAGMRGITSLTFGLLIVATMALPTSAQSPAVEAAGPPPTTETGGTALGWLADASLPGCVSIKELPGDLALSPEGEPPPSGDPTALVASASPADDLAATDCNPLPAELARNAVAAAASGPAAAGRCLQFSINPDSGTVFYSGSAGYYFIYSIADVNCTGVYATALVTSVQRWRNGEWHNLASKWSYGYPAEPGAVAVQRCPRSRTHYWHRGYAWVFTMDTSRSSWVLRGMLSTKPRTGAC